MKLNRRTLLLGGGAAAATLLAPSLAAALTCSRDEQKGCLSIQGFTGKYDPGNGLMDFVDNRLAPGTRAYQDLVTEAPFDLYKAAKRGRVSPSGREKFSLYFWNVREDIPASDFSEHRLGRNISAGTKPYAATEVDVDWSGKFDPLFDIGRPNRQFEVETGGYAFSLSTPWEMYQEDSWVVICPHGDAVYPDRRNGLREVIWLTPDTLKAFRRRDFIFTPYLFA